MVNEDRQLVESIRPVVDGVRLRDDAITDPLPAARAWQMDHVASVVARLLEKMERAHFTAMEERAR